MKMVLISIANRIPWCPQQLLTKNGKPISPKVQFLFFQAHQSFIFIKNISIIGFRILQAPLLYESVLSINNYGWQYYSKTGQPISSKLHVYYQNSYEPPSIACFFMPSFLDYIFLQVTLLTLSNPEFT